MARCKLGFLALSHQKGLGDSRFFSLLDDAGERRESAALHVRHVPVHVVPVPQL